MTTEPLFEEDYYSEDQPLDREMIDASSFLGRFCAYEVDMDDNEPPVIVYAMMPVAPACESDDLVVFDDQGHMYDSSVMRNFTAREAFSRDPYLFAQQHSDINKTRDHLNQVAREQMHYFIKHGFRGIHLEDFSYFTGFSDRSVPNDLS